MQRILRYKGERRTPAQMHQSEMATILQGEALIMNGNVTFAKMAGMAQS
jgi:hypothetical protein